jgi:hypothetical protein
MRGADELRGDSAPCLNPGTPPLALRLSRAATIPKVRHFNTSIARYY